MIEFGHGSVESDAYVHPVSYDVLMKAQHLGRIDPDTTENDGNEKKKAGSDCSGKC